MNLFLCLNGVHKLLLDDACHKISNGAVIDGLCNTCITCGSGLPLRIVSCINFLAGIKFYQMSQDTTTKDIYSGNISGYVVSKFVPVSAKDNCETLLKSDDKQGSYRHLIEILLSALIY